MKEKPYCSKECIEEKSYIGRLKTAFFKATHRKHIIYGLSYMYACTLVTYTHLTETYGMIKKSKFIENNFGPILV